MAGGRAGDDGDTATRILDSAESLVQVRGFNGFSYADVAGELSLTTASLHYHFPGKAELGRALIARYASRFNNALGRDRRRAAATRPPGCAPTRASMPTCCAARRMCLCGMLAAEYQTLPEAMRDAVIGFFDENEAWVEAVLIEAATTGRSPSRARPARRRA